MWYIPVDKNGSVMGNRLTLSLATDLDGKMLR